MTNSITINVDTDEDFPIDMESFNEVAQGHIAECLLGGRNTVNVAEMLKSGDFEPLEVAMDELTEAFGSKSEKGSPRAKLYSRVKEYAKTDKNRTPYSYKKTDDGYKIVVKENKPKTAAQVGQSSEKMAGKVADMANNAELTDDQKLDLVKEFAAKMGLSIVLDTSK